VTIRTLDAGGDKPVKGLTLDDEGNPFLGTRGIRLSLLKPDVFRVQLRALCRAAVRGNLKIMLPMVATPRDLAQGRAHLAAVVADLAARKVPYAEPPLGIMVEVPAAAIAIDRFDADFYSIGSNDLTQYVMAAARDIAALSDYADAADPAVLSLIARTVEHGKRAGREVSLPVRRCGVRSGHCSTPARCGLALLVGIGIIGRTGQGSDRGRARWVRVMADDGDRNEVNWVAEYKRILLRVLDLRPSGMRQRLADALGANRSFVSQITNPAYPVPIPPRHVEIIFDACRFPDAERRAFLEAYERAHPGRLQQPHRPSPHLRHVTLYVPDLNDPAKNAELDKMLSDMATRIAGLIAGRSEDDGKE
jgi:hypothetical protein